MFASFGKDADNSHVLITLGNIFYVQNDYSVAEEYYQKAADVSPFSYPALVNLANSLYEQKNTQRRLNMPDGPRNVKVTKNWLISSWGIHIRNWRIMIRP